MIINCGWSLSERLYEDIEKLSKISTVWFRRTKTCCHYVHSPVRRCYTRRRGSCEDDTESTIFMILQMFNTKSIKYYKISIHDGTIFVPTVFSQIVWQW